MPHPPLVGFLLLYVMLAWSSETSQIGAVKFDHFILVFQWPVTFCKIKKCKPPLPHHWTLHGFWPSNFNGDSIEKCTDRPVFDIKKIPPGTKDQMSVLWPNLLGGNEKFWKQQWDKHGKCADVPGTDTLAGYFTKVIELAKKYNIYKILENQHIKENSVKPKKVFEDAMQIETHYKTNAQLTRKDANLKPPWLFEIRICFNITFEQMNCGDGNSFKGKVLYPSEQQLKTQAKGKTCPT